MSAAEAGPSNLVEVTSPEHFTEIMQQDLTRVSLLNFYAPWAEPCKQMNEVVKEIAIKYPQVLCLVIEAESLPDVSESFDIEAVPSFVLLRGHTLLSRISGANASALSAAVATHVASTRANGTGSVSKTSAAPRAASDVYDAFNSSRNNAATAYADEEDDVQDDVVPETEEEIFARCKKLMEQSTVMLFMKGDPDTPRCGFSQKTVNLLRQEKVDFGHYDILKDENVRQGLKKLNEWPTFPQIIVNGELIGGLDILKESIESGEFKEMLQG
ncbi:probable glutaredoxin [Melanopsichium pennsylvanicum]|uniref:Probable glutaredoxin n=2 Tax=Melanopsichium pennsylvanicum TaxID=63383 RepID=A0AAJ4XQT9_9BASI|nr:probable glutaredoxin [Melanopsichium pennsylvanicum 4]SNX86231.1 probable glutaredoxin [Melanopsichium pennsylvanicum]